MLRYRNVYYRRGELWVENPATGDVSTIPCPAEDVPKLLADLAAMIRCELRYVPPALREDVVLDARAVGRPGTGESVAGRSG